MARLPAAAFWCVAIVSATALGLVAAAGFGLYALAAICVACLVITGRRRPWGPALATLPVMLIAPYSMTVQIVHKIPVADFLGWGAAGLLAMPLLVCPPKGLLRAVAIPLTIAAFGVAEGGVKTAALGWSGVIFAWLAGACLGAAIVERRAIGSAMLWMLAPTAVLTIAQFIGVSNFWALATRTTLSLSGDAVGSVYRGFGTYGQPIDAGAVCGALCLLAAGLRPARWKALCALYAVAATATLSRSAFIGLGVGLIAFTLVARGGDRRRAVTLVAVAVVVGTSIIVVPSPLSRALATRATTADNAGRASSLALAEASLSKHFGSVLFGGGFAGAQNYLASIGGNYLTGNALGDVVDNGAVSFLYDFGLIPLGLALAAVVVVIRRASISGRIAAVPGLTALASSFLFFDGLSFPSTGFMIFVFVGILAARGSSFTSEVGAALDEPSDRQPLAAVEPPSGGSHLPGEGPTTLGCPVIFVSHTAELGGAELALIRYFRTTEARSDVSLVCFESGPLVAAAQATGVSTCVIAKSAGWSGYVRHVTRVARWFATAEPAVVVVNSLSAAFATALLSRKRHRYVCYLRQEALPEDTGLPKRILLRYLVLPRFAAFLANSRWTADTIPATLRNTRPVYVVYSVSGVTATAKSPGAFRRPVKLLSLSRLAPWKGVDLILTALAELGELAEGCSLTIAGAPLFGQERYAEYLRRAASELTVPVTFVGHVTDVGALVNDHDVVISASMTPEPFGQVVIQGLAHGRAVIASDEGGPAEVIQDGYDGILFTARDSAALAGAIRRVIEAPDSLIGLRKRGIKTSEQFEDDRAVVLLERAIAAIASNSPGVKSR